MLAIASEQCFTMLYPSSVAWDFCIALTFLKFVSYFSSRVCHTHLLLHNHRRCTSPSTAINKDALLAPLNFFFSLPLTLPVQPNHLGNILITPGASAGAGEPPLES